MSPSQSDPRKASATVSGSEVLTRELRRLRRVLVATVVSRGVALTLMVNAAWLLVLASVSQRWLYQGSWDGLLSGLFWLGVCLTFALWILRPLRSRPTNAELAIWYEAQHPEWRGMLATFCGLNARVDADGSLRHLLETRISAQLQQREDSLDSIARSAWRRWSSVLTAAVACLCVTWISLPAKTTEAATRVLGWPAQRQLETWLEVVDVRERPLVPGETVFTESSPTHFRVIDTIGAPPEKVILEIQSGEHVRRVMLKGRKERLRRGTQFVFPCEIHTLRGETVRFRVLTEKDQHLPWISVAHVAPLTLSEWSVTIVPPAYLNRDPTTYPRLAGDVTAIVGSTVQIKGECLRPVAEISLLPGVGDPLVATGSQTFQFSVDIAEPGASAWLLRTVSVATPETQGTPHETATAARQVKRFDVVAIEDRAPVVELRGGTSFDPVKPEPQKFTAAGTLTLTAQARDDYGIRAVRWLARSVESRTEQVMLEESLSLVHPVEHELIFECELAQLLATVGAEFEIVAMAVDDLPEREWSLSAPFRGSILSAEELRQQFEVDLQELLRAVQMGAKQQRALTAETAEWLRKAQSATPAIASLEELKRIAKSQFQIREVFALPVTGLTQRTLRLAEAVREKSLPAPLATRVAALAQEFQALQSDALVPVTQQFQQLATRPDFVDSMAEYRDTVKQVSQLQVLQQAIDDRLQQVLEQFQLFQGHEALLEQWLTAADDLRHVMDGTLEIGRRTLSRSWEELSEQQQSELQQLAAQHRQLAARIARQLQVSTANNRQLTSIRDGMAQGQVNEKLAETARLLEQNLISRAIQQQAELKQLFEQLLPTSPAQSLNIDQRRQLAEQLRDEIMRVRSHFAQFRSATLINPMPVDASVNEDRSNQQTPDVSTTLLEHRQWTSDLAVRSQFLNAPDITKLLRQAARELQRLVQLYDELAESNPLANLAMEELANVDDALQRAEQLLDELLQELRRQRQFEDYRQLVDTLNQLELQQRKLNAATDVHIANVAADGRLTRGGRRELLELGEQQRTLAGEFAQLSAYLPAKEIEATSESPLDLAYDSPLHVAFDQLHAAILDVAQRLMNYEIGADLQSRQHALLERFRELLATITESQDQFAEQLADTAQHAAATNGLLSAAELKLLLQLQQNLIRQEEQALRNGTVNSSQSHEFTRYQTRILNLLRRHAEILTQSENER